MILIPKEPGPVEAQVSKKGLELIRKGKAYLVSDNIPSRCLRCGGRVVREGEP